MALLLANNMHRIAMLDPVDKWALIQQLDTAVAEVSMRGGRTSRVEQTYRYISALNTPSDFSTHFKGSYKSYVFKHHPDLAKNMLSKLFWHHTFLEHNIPHPKLHASCINGVHRVYNDDDSPTGYIVKPDIGTLGNGIYRVSQCEDCGPEIDWLCQERIRNCGDYTEHYRVVTLWDGRLFAVSLMSSSVPDAATSNLSQGGTSDMLCYSDGCGVSLYVDLVRDIARDLGNMHKTSFAVVFSIGWDVIVSCNAEGNPSRCYVLEGNLKNQGKQWTEDANELYRGELRTFLARHPEYKL